MTRKHRTVLIAAALVATLALAAAAGLHYRASRPVTLTLQFHPFVGTEPLVFNELRYANPGGEGRFEVRDFQFFLSNVRLAGATDAYAEPGSYHLLRFDAGRAAPVVTLRDVPRGDYDRIEFGVGVDPAANRSIEAVGDLDPNGRMAWTWDVGYKFVLLEGALVRDGQRSPIVYHVGFDENYRTVSTAVDARLASAGSANLDFRVDVLKIFTGQATVDMAALPKVVFDRNDAALLARNYAGMISAMPAGPASGPVGPRAP
jgi:hypothetical protein